MGAIIPALIGGGVGVLQGESNKKKDYEDMMLKAEMAKYAPYSQMASQIGSAPMADRPDTLQTLFKGAATGAQVGDFLKGDAGNALGLNKQKMTALTPDEMNKITDMGGFKWSTYTG